MSGMWKTLPCAASELQLRATLEGGQSFRWKQHPSIVDSWLGVMGNCLWLLRQSDQQLEYQVLGELPYPAAEHIIVRMKLPEPKALPKTTKSKKNSSIHQQPQQLLYHDSYYANMLHTYFRLDHQLADKHYVSWSAAHPHFRAEAGKFYAIRQLDQEPVENLFSFICSQNNHIARISMLVEKLCSLYGEHICDYAGESYHAFPGCERLAHPEVDAQLREAKFGYRAKFIQQSAAQICKRGGLEWFERLQRMPYSAAHAELRQLTGIGPKVADCICLMSLGHLDAIPVDTHVYQIAAQHYMPELAAVCKSVTARQYAAIGDRFRDVYGPLAGWAQTVLFCADLAKFKKDGDNAEPKNGKLFGKKAASSNSADVVKKRSKVCGK